MDNFGHPMVAWRAHHLAGLGDDSSILLGLGFNSLQIQQIMSAHADGSLSDDGYQQLVSGTVDPSRLADFMLADLGAPTVSSGNSVPTPGGGSPTTALLNLGPSPKITAPGATPSFSTWLNSATLVT
ncbi:MAG TPA: hypothetical protein VGS41_04370 [Chthonomonadales bacterium]|nr:hypothetical protein [Chthonomonadales bacterium]